MNLQNKTSQEVPNIDIYTPEVQRVIADFLNSFYLALDNFAATVVGKEADYHMDTLWVGNI